MKYLLPTPVRCVYVETQKKKTKIFRSYSANITMINTNGQQMIDRTNEKNKKQKTHSSCRRRV